MVTQKRINELFTYRDGMIFRNVRTSINTKVGERAGSKSKSDGYRYVYIDNKNYKEHAIIWIMHFGEIPDGLVLDHRDRVRDNNKIENIRLATYSQNTINSAKRNNSTSSFIGVSYWKYDDRNKKWRAYISADNIRKTIGYFNTEIEAAKAYDDEAIKLHGEFAKLNFVL